MGEYTPIRRLALPKLPALPSLLSRANLEFSQNNPQKGGVYGRSLRERPLAIIPQFSSLLRMGNVGRLAGELNPRPVASMAAW